MPIILLLLSVAVLSLLTGNSYADVFSDTELSFFTLSSPNLFEYICAIKLLLSSISSGSSFSFLNFLNKLPNDFSSTLLSYFICSTGAVLTIIVSIGTVFVSSFGFSVSATRSPFNKLSLIAWYTALNTLLSSSNLTSNFAGCTFTSTFCGFISIFKTKKPYFPIVIKPLYPCSAALVSVLSFTYLLFTKNNWFERFERAITGFPITPVTVMSS